MSQPEKNTGKVQVVGIVKSTPAVEANTVVAAKTPEVEVSAEAKTPEVEVSVEAKTPEVEVSVEAKNPEGDTLDRSRSFGFARGGSPLCVHTQDWKFYGADDAYVGHMPKAMIPKAIPIKTPPKQSGADALAAAAEALGAKGGVPASVKKARQENHAALDAENKA